MRVHLKKVNLTPIVFIAGDMTLFTSLILLNIS